MRWLTLLLLLGLMAPYGGAQDEDEEDDTEIDIGEDPGKTEKVEGLPKRKNQGPATIERINAAIDAGVAWLKKRQDENGSWGPCVGSGSYDGPRDGPDSDCYFIGPTVFSIFTLRKCGVPRKDPVIKAGLKWLSKRLGKSYQYTSYESAAMIMMLVALNKVDPPPPGQRWRKKKPKKKEHRFAKSTSGPPKGVPFKKSEWKIMHARVRELVRKMQNKGGGWRYGPANGDQDLSATQFALLGLRAASQAGYPVHLVSADTWRSAAKAVKTLRVGDGGFHYHAKKTPRTLGMTTAGIASLLICKEQLQLCAKPVPEWIDADVATALEVLGKDIDFTRNSWEGMKRATTKTQPHGIGYHYYYLYGIERVGALSGRKEIGGKAWYPRGAKFLVNNQAEEGSWTDGTCMRPEDVLGTCFALLFLKKATPPAVTASR